jgi:nicotinamide phosphoribosyltransferase
MTDYVLGKGSVDPKLMEDLHDLGYLPLHIRALPEGTICPVKVPLMTIINTKKEFYWLTNFIETLTQTVLWQGIVSATIALEYRKILNKYAAETSDDAWFVDWQAHDFSMRGMSSIETGAISGAAHLLSFTGTDTFPAIEFLEQYYGADIEKELVGSSVPATEHAVMCAGLKVAEQETFRRLIEDVYPKGIVSIVSDTWDFWSVLTNILPSLKDKIMARDGKVVIRPDSGDPVKIVTGYFVKPVPYSSDVFLSKIASDSFHLRIWNDDKFDAVMTTDDRFFDIDGKELSECEVLGAIAILSNVFGHSVNSKGFMVLYPHIGLIYGDSITLKRCEHICERLKRKGYASTNVVFGVGSYTYQYNTRDTFSLACKATWVMTKGIAYAISKDPKTDSGNKKSASGLLKVVRDGNNLVLHEDVTMDEVNMSNNELKTVFLDGELHNFQTLSSIRKRLKNESAR